MTVHPHPNITRAAEGLDRRRFTVAEVEAMVAFGLLADERNELIGGELVPMSPKRNRHEVVKTALLRRWYRAIPETHDLTPETTFRLSEDTYLEPDMVVYERATGLAGLTGAATAALLVVEISDTSLRYDAGRKAALYARFGVRELWVIDVAKLVIGMYREPSDNGYRSFRELAADAVVTPLIAPPELALRLVDLGV